jgi:SAM-dependent methyltransferase
VPWRWPHETHPWRLYRVPAGAFVSGEASRAGSDAWSERAELYRTSAVHVEGPDLDLIVEWSAGSRTALDVATGGGHVARRLRDTGLEVVTCDPAPGMGPDVICHAEDLPFADASFDIVVCRRAAHHFLDVPKALAEMARVASGLVLLQDAVRVSEEVEEAESLRDPSHVRHLTEDEWRDVFERSGLEVDAAERFEERLEFASWFARTGCEGETADRVRSLLAKHTDGDAWIYPYMAFKTRKR